MTGLTEMDFELCKGCDFAEWDYEDYYGTTAKQWFICGCKADKCDRREEEDD